MHISLVVAVTDNNVIGADGKRGFYLYADMMFFKELTAGQPVIMGRRTFQSLRNPLPHKPNIVLSRDLSYSPAGVIVAPSLKSAIKKAESFSPTEIFIIGGQEVFTQAISLADKIYLTRVHTSIAGDTFFDYDLSSWRVSSNKKHQKDDKNDYDYDFIIYDRQ